MAYQTPPLPADGHVLSADDIIKMCAEDDGAGGLQLKAGIAASIAIDEFPAAAVITDDFSNPTTTSIMGMNMVWDGSKWDRAPGTSADGLLVNLGSNNDATVTGPGADGAAAVGNPVRVAGTSGTGTTENIITDADGHLQIDVLSAPSTTVTATNLDIRDLANASDSVAIYGSDDGGTTKRIIKTDSGGAIQVDLEVASVGVTGGQAADGAAVAGNPVRIGAKDGTGNTQDVISDADGHLQVDVLTTTAATLTPHSGTKTVAAAITPEALTTTTLARSIVIVARSTNTGLVYIGDSANQYVPLAANAQLSIEGDGDKFDLANIYCKVAVNGEIVDFFYLS
jgi:hypothetical protein